MAQANSAQVAKISCLCLRADAEYSCKECKQYFCGTCRISHMKAKVSKSHHLVKSLEIKGIPSVRTSTYDYDKKIKQMEQVIEMLQMENKIFKEKDEESKKALRFKEEEFTQQQKNDNKEIKQMKQVIAVIQEENLILKKENEESKMALCCQEKKYSLKIEDIKRKAREKILIVAEDVAETCSGRLVEAFCQELDLKHDL